MKQQMPGEGQCMICGYHYPFIKDEESKDWRKKFIGHTKGHYDTENHICSPEKLKEFNRKMKIAVSKDN